MTKNIFRTLAFLFVFSAEANAQQSSVDLLYGNMLYQKDFLGQLNTLDNYKQSRPMQYLGIGTSGGFRVNRKWEFSGNMFAAQYLPQRFHANDSVTGKISGSLFGVTVGYDVFRKAKAIDLIFGGGLNLGRLKLVQNDYLHWKNMLITPKLSVIAKVYIGKFSLFAGAEYGYDISGSDWKEKRLASKRHASVPVPAFNQSGFNLSVGLCWILDGSLTTGP
jgi:hypothetical protein